MRSIRNSARELYSDPAAEALKGMKSLMKAEESLSEVSGILRRDLHRI